jgi:uncharacterized repeat protein (TIGR01451 family)
MSGTYQLPPEFDLSPRARAAQRRLLELEIGGRGSSPAVRRRTVLIAAALILGAVLVAPAFGLGQKLVEVLMPSSPPPRPTQADEEKKPSARPRADDKTVPKTDDETAPERKSVTPQRRRAASGAPDGSPDEGAVISAQKRCKAGSRPAIIADEPRCLRIGQRCARRHDRQYHPHRFHCHGRALTAHRADLSLTMTAAPEPVLLGDALKYTLTVRNRGPDALPDASVIAELPAGAAERYAIPSRGRCRTEQAAAARVVCVLPAMARGATATILVTVHVQTPGALASRATASSPIADPSVANNSVTAVTSVRQGFVRGSGNYSLFGDYGIVVVEVDAFGGPNGSGRGTFSYRRTYRGQTLEVRGHVICLRVDGNRARVTGMVDASNGVSILEEGVHPLEQTGTVAVGHGVILAFTDGAGRGADTILTSVPVVLDGPVSAQRCPITPTRSLPPELALTDGDFVVGLLPP